MSSDEVDKKTEEENLKETESSAEENEEKVDAKEEKVNSKPPAKKKNAEPPKIKQPAKKRVKTEQEETKKEDKKEEKKKVAKKVEEESDDDDEEDDTDKVPLLDQPLEVTGSRKRKEVERFVPKALEVENKEVKIPEGKGKALGSIETIEFNLQRANPEVLKCLHRLCFKGVGKVATLKKNIKQFNGWEFDESSEEFEKKKTLVKTSFKKVTIAQLKSICMVLEIEKSGTKDDILDRILNFLVCPVDSGKTVPKGRSKRKAATKKNYDEGDDTFDSKKKEKKKGKGKKKDVESEEEESEAEDEEEEEESEKEEKNAKQNNTDKKKEKKENSTEESEPEEQEKEEEEEEEEPDEEEKPKKGVKNSKKAAEVADKKAPPKKRAAAKKAAEKAADSEEAVEGDDESEEGDKPVAKKSKTPPTDEELVTFIKDLLQGANLELITMKKVCQDVFAKYSDFDLSHKKDFIKTTVKNLISS